VQRFSRAQVEAGMVPGAADGIADHEPVRQWAVVVRALRPDREYLISAADEQDGLAAGMAGELAAIGEVSQCNTLSEIRAAQLGCSFGHPFLPWQRPYNDTVA
jgi:hypothetical protein